MVNERSCICELVFLLISVGFGSFLVPWKGGVHLGKTKTVHYNKISLKSCRILTNKKKSHCVVFQLTKVSSLLTAAHFGLTAFTTLSSCYPEFSNTDFTL